MSFSADPSTIDEGENSTLEWSTTNATSCTASDGWNGNKATSGEEDVTPDETTTYTLSCSGAGGTISESVTVTVEDEPVPTPTLEFEADPVSVAPNGTSTLSWDSTDATSCVASDGWSGSKSLDGSEVVTVSATTTYTLVCGNGVSTSTESVTVHVVDEPEPEPTVEITADPTTIEEGDSSELSWNSENATSCTASNGWTGSKALDGTEEVSPTATTTYAIECTGPGGTAQDSVTITVTEAQDAPTVSLDADPTEVTPGAGSATSTLTWTTNDADLCIATDGWSGTKNLSGSEIVEPNATTTYTLECSNEAGTSTDSVTVNFVPEEEPEPSVGHLLISEVHYDPDIEHGSDANEWVELYNPTDSSVDLSTWAISDVTVGNGVRMFPAGTTIAAQGFLVVSNSSTTPNFWTIPGSAGFVSLERNFGNGLANGGDNVFLMQITGGATTTIDALSYGPANTEAFDPPVPDVADGHSLYRTSLLVDTNTAADWADDDAPTPGQAN